MQRFLLGDSSRDNAIPPKENPGKNFQRFLTFGYRWEFRLCNLARCSPQQRPSSAKFHTGDTFVMSVAPSTAKRRSFLFWQQQRTQSFKAIGGYVTVSRQLG